MNRREFIAASAASIAALFVRPPRPPAPDIPNFPGLVVWIKDGRDMLTGRYVGERRFLELRAYPLPLTISQREAVLRDLKAHYFKA